MVRLTAKDLPAKPFRLLQTTGPMKPNRLLKQLLNRRLDHASDSFYRASPALVLAAFTSGQGWTGGRNTITSSNRPMNAATRVAAYRTNAGVM
jgi:hypothetical protein